MCSKIPWFPLVLVHALLARRACSRIMSLVLVSKRHTPPNCLLVSAAKNVMVMGLMCVARQYSCRTMCLACTLAIPPVWQSSRRSPAFCSI